MFTEECINTFLENQEQLFPQAVAESYEAAEAFLEDCMAQVVDSIEEVREYLEESGADVEGMSDLYQCGRSDRHDGDHRLPAGSGYLP